MSFLNIRRLPLYFQKLSLRINMQDMTILPFIMITSLVLFICISFSELEMPMLSFGVLILVLACFAVMLTLVMRRHEMTYFGFAIFIYFLLLIVLTIVNVNDIRNSIYTSCSVWLMLLIMRYYRWRMDMVLKSFCIAFSVCIYINFAHIITHPMLWILQDEKSGTGYLLGNNYNQMGCRLIIGLATNLLCLRYSKLWLVNFIGISVASIASLAMVGSMTSLSMVSLFLVFCMIPSARLRRLGIYGLFVVFVLFQVFVVFNGRGLEDNELAVYIIEDVLQKDLTFTNRTHMWESALKIIGESPLWGWGYPDGDWYKSNMTALAIGPHNFILSVLINGGLILFSLYCGICVMAYKAIRPFWQDAMLQKLVFAVLCLWVMSLMEMYMYSIMIYPLVLLFYYKYYAETNNPKQII